MPGLSEALQAAKEIESGIGLLARVVQKLKAQPDVAALKLADALDEIAKTFTAVDDAAAAYVGTAFDMGGAGRELARLEGGALRARIEDGRGHCHRIDNIYRAYLDKWFERAFDRNDYDQVRRLFVQLATADGSLFPRLASMAIVLQGEARAVLDLLANGREADAKQRILRMRTELLPLRTSLAASLAELFRLKSELVAIADIA